MSGGGGADTPAPPPSSDGGEFLLSLLRKPQLHNQDPSQLPLPLAAPLRQEHHQHQQQQQPLALDPAVAAVGPTLADFPTPPWPLNRRDLSGTPANLPSWPHTLSPPNLLGFPQFPPNHFSPNQFHGNQRVLEEDSYKLGFPENANQAIKSLLQQKQQPQELPKLLFGSFSANPVQSPNVLPNGNLLFESNRERDLRNRQSANSSSNSGPNAVQQQNFDFREHRAIYNGNNDRNFKPTPPPGFSGKQRGWNQDFGSHNCNNNSRGVVQHNGERGRIGHGEFSNRSVRLNGEDEMFRKLSIQDGDSVGLCKQLDHPGPPAGSNLHAVSASDVEESLSNLHSVGLRREGDQDCEKCDGELDEFGEELVDSLLLEDEADEKDEKDERKKSRNSREKESRIDDRGQWLLSQRLRILRRQMACRNDIHRLNAPFLAVYESLIPAEEEQAKQKQLLALLERLVSKEWPKARLYLYGSCANSFGFSKSDIDVCLAVEDPDIKKSEMLLKLADILQSGSLQNVQALTRARVPIVKLMDPVTGISCDICINNVLAVVNTKLLRDYSRIDVRLRQLALIVKHWAKSRRVNETYQGTLSSYAYVLMCIHFLQQRRPAILPCLQEMEPTYSVTLDDIQCAYFDEVDKLCNFGARNKETVSQLVWGFFNYWAYGHDYANSVISVRTGSILSKREKDWTRRIGNDRHLICIEDPFEISHDLGRVVDKFSIRVLRGEFERAAEIMQHDPNPCVTLFDPYVRPN